MCSNMCKFRISMIVFPYRSSFGQVMDGLGCHYVSMALNHPLWGLISSTGAHIQQAGSATCFEALSAFRTSLAAQRPETHCGILWLYYGWLGILQEIYGFQRCVSTVIQILGIPKGVSQQNLGFQSSNTLTLLSGLLPWTPVFGPELLAIPKFPNGAWKMCPSFAFTPFWRVDISSNFWSENSSGWCQQCHPIGVATR
jgi:hypothetical protein